MRPRHPFGGIRDDLFWRGKRHMLVALWNHYEVHRTNTANDAGIRRPLNSHMDSRRMEAASEQSQTVLHHIRTLGRRGCCMADSSQR